jgi:dihydroorotate dehydrogenase electron transfer subunit
MDYLRTAITEVERHGSDCVLLRFAGDRPIEGAPGQFAMVRGDWGTDPILPRAFSLVEVGDTGAILVRVVGAGTKRLFEMRVGDSLAVLGPSGRGFSEPDVDRLPVIIAGGIGVAPLVFMAERIAAQGKRAVFIYGARNEQDLLLLERIEKSADLVLTTEDGSRGEKGVVTGPLKRILKKGGPVQLFSCGPEPMLKAVASLALDAQAPCETAIESPMACGMGTCKGCAVLGADGKYRYVCADGPVFEAAEIFGGVK